MNERMILTWGVCAALLSVVGACSRKVEDAPRIAPPPPAEALLPSPAPQRRPPPPRRAPEPEVPAAPVRPADTLNGDPDGLKRDQLNAVIQAALPSLASCFDGNGGGQPTVGLQFDVVPEGKATNVRVQGAPPEATRCVSDRLVALSLPPFKGQPVPVTLPLTVFRPVAAAPPPPAPTAAAPPATAPASPAGSPQPSTSLGTSNLPTMPTREAPAGPTGNPATFIQP